MIIECMTADDLEAVASLAAQLGYPCSPAELTARFERLEHRPEYGLFVAKGLGGRVLGYLQINAEPETLLADPRADIAALVVEQTARGTGIGTALLKRAEAWAKEHQLPLIRVRSNARRAEAHRFYEKHGYALQKTSHMFTRFVL